MWISAEPLINAGFFNEMTVYNYWKKSGYHGVFPQFLKSRPASRER